MDPSEHPIGTNTEWWLGVTGAFLLGALAMGTILFSGPDLADNDSYYHIRFARITWEQGLVRDFPWARFTLFSEQFADKEFLFHLLLIPFAWGDLIVAAKVATCTFAGAIFAAFYATLHSIRCRAPFLWTLALLGSGPGFLYRIALTRAHLLSVLMLLLMVIALERRSRTSLFLLAALYPMSYSASYLLAAFVALYLVGRRLAGNPWDLRTLGWAAAGTVLGTVLNPYFPNSATIWFWQTLVVPFHVWGISGVNLDQGREFLSPSLSQIVFQTPVLVLGLVTVVGTYFWRRRWPSERNWSLATLAVGCLALFLLSQRFIEYFAPFGLLFCASAWDELYGVPALAGTRPWRGWARACLTGALVPLLALAGIQSTTAPQMAVIENRNRDIAEAAQWLHDHLPPGQAVFHTRWDHFPVLFHFAPEHRYLVALDPIFLFAHDQGLWRLWRDISAARCPDPAGAVRERFRSDVVVLDHQRQVALDQWLRQAAGARQVFRNESVAVFQL